MPKAQHIEEKYINGIRVDKENETCAFNDEKHLYFDKKTMQPYISVTQIISKYCQEFDEEFWSFYKALESFIDEDIFYPIKKTLLARKKVDKRLIKKLGLDLQQVLDKQEEIKTEYKRKRDESCERGVNIHAAFENSFYNRTKFDFSKYGYKDLVGEFTCIENRNTLAPGNGVYPEFLISVVSRDGILRLSGQIDCLIIQGNDVYIIDWKSNGSIDKTSYYNRSTKKYQMMKFPLNNRQDCNFEHYQLQLSLYAYMLQQINPNYNIKGLKLVHIDHNNKQHEYDVEYLKDDVERMLKHYKRELKKQIELEKLKPVIC